MRASTTCRRRSSSSCRRTGGSPYATIAKRVGLSEAAVRQRVQRLLDPEVMQIVAVTDPLQVGFRRQAMIGIRVDGDLPAGRRRPDGDVGGRLRRHHGGLASTCSPRSSARTTTELLDLLTTAHPHPSRGADHRDVRLPETQQAALQLGYPMTTEPAAIFEPSSDTHTPLGTLHSEAARDHLWMHFTRHSVFEDRSDGGLGHSVPIITRGEGHKIWDDRGNEYIDGLAGLFVVQVGHGREELAEAAAKQAKELAFFPLWSYAHPRAIELAERLAAGAPGRPQPRLLHHRRRRGRRDRLEAGQAVLQADRQADQAQGHQPRGRLPRHPAGRPVHHRHPRGQGDVRAAGARRLQGARTPTSTARPSTCATTRRPSAAGPPTGSPRPSSSRAPTPWPPSSSSRCRTPAAASRRRPATSSGFARSATSTTCCSSPTR